MRISVREWMQADGNIRADGALIQRPADADVDKEKGTCLSVCLGVCDYRDGHPLQNWRGFPSVFL